MAINLHQSIRGQLCADPECRRVAVEEDILRVKQGHLSAIEARVRGRLRELSVAAAEGVLVVAVPSNDLPLVTSDAARVAAFRAHLEQLVAQLHDADAIAEPQDADALAEPHDADALAEPQDADAQAASSGSEPEPSGADRAPEADRGAERWPPVAAQICATCRGQCCQRGDTHAWLTVDGLRRILGERPELSPSSLADEYLRHLPPHSYEGSCVYHGDRGCGLPRALRADTCNAFSCESLSTARREHAVRPDAALFAIATDGIWPHPRFSAPSLRRGALVVDGQQVLVTAEALEIAAADTDATDAGATDAGAADAADAEAGSR